MGVSHPPIRALSRHIMRPPFDEPGALTLDEQHVEHLEQHVEDQTRLSD